MIAALLGHLVLDEIHTTDGATIESLGGIHFPLSAMAALAGAGDQVRPVFPIGADARPQFDGMYADRGCIDARWCGTVDAPNTRVRLFHDSLAQYNTQLVRSLGPLALTTISPAIADADLVYANMMTGEDLLIADAIALRHHTRGLVYLDLHMIAYHVGAHGARATAPIEAWRDWVNVPDVLQCNERELASLGGDCIDERARVARIFEASRLRLLVVTRGEAGASLYPSEGGRIDVPAVPPPALVDPTGCGDVFGATLAWHLADGVPLHKAARTAAHAAAYVVSIPGSIGLDRLADHLHGAKPCA